MTATLRVPSGYRLDGDVVLSTPLSRAPITAVRAVVIGGTLFATFDKADLDNNVPGTDTAPLTISADLLNRGNQQRFTSTALLHVVK